MPVAPFDDPAIPVLTERLLLPEQDPEASRSGSVPTEPPAAAKRPADTPAPEAAAPRPAPALAAPPAPATATATAPEPATATATAAPTVSPQVLGAQFDADQWLVGTIPLAPAPLDPSTLDLPTFELPPLAPIQPEARTAPAALAPATASAAPLDLAPGVVPQAHWLRTEVAIPASLMRAPAPQPATMLRDEPALPPATTLPMGAPIDTRSGRSGGPPLAAAETPVPAPPDFAQLRAAIVAELARQLPPDAESIVRRHLAPAVDAAIGAAVAQIVPEIRRAVVLALSELVEQALRAQPKRIDEQDRH